MLRSLLLALALALGIMACDFSPTALPPTGPTVPTAPTGPTGPELIITGLVTIDGEPADSAVIAVVSRKTCSIPSFGFPPSDGTIPCIFSVLNRTDADGRYSFARRVPEFFGDSCDRGTVRITDALNQARESVTYDWTGCGPHTIDHDFRGSDLGATVTPSAIQLTPGSTFQLSARITSSSGESVPAIATWSSSSPSVASVATSGLVTAISAGEATITATSGEKSGTATVRVTDPSGQPFGPQAYVSSGSGITVIDVATNTVLSSPIDVIATDMAVTPDGSRVYLTRRGSDDVRVIDTNTNTVLESSIPVGREPRGIAITPDGSRAYVANLGSDEISVIDLGTDSVVQSIPTGDRPGGIVITPDGDRAYVTLWGGQEVVVIDLNTNVITAPPIAVPGPQGMAVTPDGRRIYVVLNRVFSVAVIDTDTNTRVGFQIPVGRFPGNIAITPDGSRAYVANPHSDNVSVIDLATNNVVATVPSGYGPRDLAVTPDGAYVYVVNEFGHYVSIIDVTTNTLTGIPIGLDIGVAGFPAAIAITP